jgi:hypothetical protein
VNHRPRAAATLLIALLLAAATPVAAIQAASPSSDTTADTPMNKNLAHNAGFEAIRSDGTLKGWTVEGDLHTETFGTRAWPYPAYSTKYHGGKRYLACGKGSGLVRQVVPFQGTRVRHEFHFRARLQVNFGGIIGHKIRVTLKATGTGPDGYSEKLRVMDINNSYKEAFTAITLPDGADRLEITVELMRKPGASSCRMVADSVRLDVIKF